MAIHNKDGTLDYTGYSVRCGFLTGNLADGDDPGAYAGALQNALEDAYPGAEVDVRWESASGSTPRGLRPALYDRRGDEVWGGAERIDSISEEVFADDSWREAAP